MTDPKPDVCRFCGQELTANEIKAYGDMCTWCWPEYVD